MNPAHIFFTFALCLCQAHYLQKNPYVNIMWGAANAKLSASQDSPKFRRFKFSSKIDSTMHRRSWRSDLLRCCHLLEDKGKRTRAKESENSAKERIRRSRHHCNQDVQRKAAAITEKKGERPEIWTLQRKKGFGWTAVNIGSLSILGSWGKSGQFKKGVYLEGNS